MTGFYVSAKTGDSVTLMFRYSSGNNIKTKVSILFDYADMLTVNGVQKVRFLTQTDHSVWE